MNGGEPTPTRGLLVDKPAGMTSHDVFATGLLIVLIGRATRLQRYLLALPKAYRATARLGWRSSTGDPDGELSETGQVPQSLELPTGESRSRRPPGGSRCIAWS